MCSVDRSGIEVRNILSRGSEKIGILEEVNVPQEEIYFWEMFVTY